MDDDGAGLAGSFLQLQQHSVREFEEYCKSDELSIVTLRDRTRRITPGALTGSDAFIFACENGRVTRAVVEHFLRVYPELVRQRRRVETGGIVVPGLSEEPLEDTPFPLHALCFNRHCKSGRAITKVVEAYPDAARCEIRTMGDGRVGLTALHLYMRARRDGDLRLVKLLVSLHPDALTKQGVEVGPDNELVDFTPLGSLLSNWKVISPDFVEALLDKDGKCINISSGRHLPVVALLHNPYISSIPMKVFENLAKRTVLTASYVVALDAGVKMDNIFHHACASKFVTVEIINFLLDIDENLTTTIMGKGNHQNEYPLHILCRNTELDDETSLALLKILIKKCPEAVKFRVKDRLGQDMNLPIHDATRHMSLDCCKLLIEEYPGCWLDKAKLKNEYYPECIEPGSMVLPLHLACACRSLEFVKYFVEREPQSLNHPTREPDFCFPMDDKSRLDEKIQHKPLPVGNTALHIAVHNKHKDMPDIVRFILDEGKAHASNLGKWGRTPLHEACASDCLDLQCVTAIFNAFPRAIHTDDVLGRLPIHFLFGCHELRRGYKSNGCLPTKSIQSSVADFLIRQLPYSLSREARDFYGMTCLIIACLGSQALQKIDIISERAEIDSMEAIISLTHICTRGGNLDVFKYIGEVISPGLFLSPFVDVLAPYMLAKCKEPQLFQFVFTKRYGNSLFHRAIKDGSLRTLEDPSGSDIHDEAISNFLKFSNLTSKTEMFQSDCRRKDRNGSYMLHLIFGARTTLNNVISLIDLYPEAAGHADNRGWLVLQV